MTHDRLIGWAVPWAPWVLRTVLGERGAQVDVSRRFGILVEMWEDWRA